jgi:hypothetical protein
VRRPRDFPGGFFVQEQVDKVDRVDKEIMMEKVFTQALTKQVGNNDSSALCQPCQPYQPRHPNHAFLQYLCPPVVKQQNSPHGKDSISKVYQ